MSHGRIPIGMRGGAKPVQSVNMFLHKEVSNKKKKHLTDNPKNVKPVCDPLFRPKESS